MVGEVTVRSTVGQPARGDGRVGRVIGSRTISVGAGATLRGVVVAAGAGARRFADAFATARIGSSGQ